MHQQKNQNNMNDRKYVIFSCSEINKINFNQVMETSSETLRKSVDKTKTFIKYSGEMPSCVELLETKTKELTYEEIIEILNTSEWIDSTQNL